MASKSEIERVEEVIESIAFLAPSVRRAIARAAIDTARRSGARRKR